MKQEKRRPRWMSAFTLIELMVVVVIIGVMATAVTLSVSDYLVTAKRNVAQSEISTIQNALTLFFMEHDRFPTDEEGLALLKKPSPQHAHGILTSDLKDPWNREYIYIYPGTHGTFDLVSFGADGQEGGMGGNQDVASWELDDAQD